tara:strand:+ start:933 stop:1583 length:651 start_codon:yes stop_codon:yes gene_type:complete
MEIPEIKIPEINIQTINIPINNPNQVLNIPLPSLKMPGCFKYHRDASPKNTALYDDDPKGTTISCPFGSMPTYEPLLYDPRKIEITEVKEEKKEEVKEVQPEYKQEKPKLPKKKEEEFFIKCPGDKDLRVGMFASEDRLEKVVGHKISEDGKTCITLFEESRFVDRWIPSPPLIINTSLIAITAATSPLIVNFLKNIVKTAVKKATSRKSKNVDAE